MARAEVVARPLDRLAAAAPPGSPAASARRRASCGRPSRRTAPPSTRLTVSVSGSAGTTPSAPPARPRSTRSTRSGGRQRPRGVVHQHERGAVGQGVEPLAHRLGPRRPARDRGGDLVRAEVVGQQAGALLPALGHDDDDAVDGRVLLEHLQRRGEQRPPREAHERLRPVGSEALAAAAGHHHGPDGQRLGLAQAATREKIILPDGLCRTLVTSTSIVVPTMLRPPSTTIIVPSSR